MRGGYLQSGDFARGAGQFDGDYRMTSQSAGVDQRFRRHLMLAQLKSRSTFTAVPDDMFSVNLNGVLIMGGGSTANFSLFKEVSSAPSAVTYTPASKIAGLYAGVIGAATNTERLFICMVSTAIDVHSVAGTSLGSMHANTANAWGVMQTPVNAATPGTPQLLIGSNNSIYTLPVSSAIGAAPTQVLSGLPNGGAALGIEQVPKNWPLRAYWIMPYKNISGATWMGLVGAGSRVADVWSTNLEGTDRQLVPLPLTTVNFAALWRRNIVATDGTRIVSWDGDVSRDLHVLSNRKADSDVKRAVTALAVNDNDLYAVLTHQITGGTGTTITLEQYIPEFDAWVQVSAIWVPTVFALTAEPGPWGYTVTSHSMSPQVPVSKETSRMYLGMAAAGTGTDIDHVFLPPSGHNPYYLYRKTGSGNGFAQQWETTGTWYSPYYQLPTLEGRRKRVDEIVFGGEIAEGTVSVTINPNEGGTAVIFAGTEATRAQQVEATDADFDLLQVLFTLTQGSDTRKTMQALPITLRGRAYLTDPSVDGLGLPGGGSF